MKAESSKDVKNTDEDYIQKVLMGCVDAETKPEKQSSESKEIKDETPAPTETLQQPKMPKTLKKQVTILRTKSNTPGVAFAAEDTNPNPAKKRMSKMQRQVTLLKQNLNSDATTKGKL